MKETQEKPVEPSPKWATYVRVSTEDTTRQGMIVAMQRAQIYPRFLAFSSFSDIKEYIEMVSGTSNDQPALKQLLKDARDGKFSHLALQRLDRFSRDVEECWRIVAELKDMGITIHVAFGSDLVP